MHGIFLVLILIITGGAIAFLGDKIGSKVGKKRLSIFGLRPKHTSILVTILTGVLITATTLGVMAIASENVRTALFGLEQLYEELANTNENLEQAKLDRSTAESDLLAIKGDLQSLQDQRNELWEKNKVLQEGNDELEAAKQELTERYINLSEANEILLISQADLQAGNEALNDDNKKLSDENFKLEERNVQLKNSMLVMREGDIVFRAGEVIASGKIKAGIPESEIKANLQDILEQAKRNAILHLSQKIGAEVSEDDCLIWLYQPEYDYAVETIKNDDGDYLVRILSAGNLIRGEAIRSVIKINKNFKVYDDGELVLSKYFDLTGKTNEEKENTLVQFLRNVNEEAIQQGMLADTLNGSVGVIDGTQIFNAMQQLDSAQGMVLLSAYAHGSTEVMGPLKINLKVEN